jgi:hypothetical protein
MTYDHIIVVEELLSEVTQDEILNTVSRTSSLEVSNTGCIDYSILWRRIAKLQTDTLVWSILFSQQLESRLDELGITQGTLICGKSLEKPYVQVVEDIAERTSLETRQPGSEDTLSTLFVAAQMIFIIAKMGFVIGDWFIARLIGLFTETHNSNIAYFPAIERLDSSLPVVDRFDTKPQTVVTEPASYFHLQFDIASTLGAYRPAVAHQYLSVSGFLGEIRDVGTVTHEVLTLSSFTPNLVDAVESEFDVRLELTIGVLIRKTLSNFHLVRALVVRRALRAFFSETDINKTIIGTLDPVGRAVTTEACEQNVQVYHIPHSIATTEPPYPKSEVIQFVSGDLDVQYYEQVVPEELWWEWVPLGRPYLSNLYEQYTEQRNEQSTIDPERTQFEIVVATVSAPQHIREEFIETMCEYLQADRFTVSVKPHPDENVKLYERMETEYENVRVIRSGLYDAICTADLTVTINSNVGLESMVIGTPAVCFNSWRPFVVDQTYALFEEVPIFRSGAEFQSFATQLDGSKLSDLRERQSEFVEESYLLESDTAAKIAEYIQSDNVETRP